MITRFTSYRSSRKELHGPDKCAYTKMFSKTRKQILKTFFWNYHILLSHFLPLFRATRVAYILTTLSRGYPQSVPIKSLAVTCSYITNRRVKVRKWCNQINIDRLMGDWYLQTDGLLLSHQTKHELPRTRRSGGCFIVSLSPSSSINQATTKSFYSDVKLQIRHDKVSFFLAVLQWGWVHIHRTMRFRYKRAHFSVFVRAASSVTYNTSDTSCKTENRTFCKWKWLLWSYLV